jgi:hypothetical protein
MARALPVVLVMLGSAPLVAAQAPSPLWVRQFGAWMQGDRARAAAPDGSGGVYVTGGWVRDVYLARFDSAGTELWLRQINLSVNDQGLGVCPAEGGAYIAGLTAPGGIQTADGFIARYDTQGEQLWVRLLGGPQVTWVLAIAPDADGGAYVAGNTGDSLAAPNQGSYDAFIARYDGDGNRLWIRQFGSDSLEEATALAPDGQGGVFIGGYTHGSLAAPHLGRGDIWMARYTSGGERLWIKQFGTQMFDAVTAMTPALGGGVHITGIAEGSLAGSSNGGEDAFLGHVNDQGDVTWLGQYGTSSNERPRAIAADGAGGAYIAGDIPSSGSWGCPSAGFSDAFIAHIAADGALRWACQIGSNDFENGYGCAADGAGGAYLVGRTGGSIVAPNPWGDDSFIARYPGPCYANCDQSTQPPALNVADFACFLQKFAEGHGYANCDLSSTPPMLNIADFACFLQKFAAGCP